MVAAIPDCPRKEYEALSKVVAAFLLSLTLTMPAAGQGHQDGAEKKEPEKKEEVSPEEKMRRRYPQPVLISDLVGIRVVDRELGSLGRAKSVVRTPEGKIQIVMSYGGFLGLGDRAIAVPVEAVAMLGRMMMIMDMPKDQLAIAPTWYGSNTQPVGPKDKILVGLTKK